MRPAIRVSQYERHKWLHGDVPTSLYLALTWIAWLQHRKEGHSVHFWLNLQRNFPPVARQRFHRLIQFALMNWWCAVKLKRSRWWGGVWSWSIEALQRLFIPKITTKIFSKTLNEKCSIFKTYFLFALRCWLFRFNELNSAPIASRRFSKVCISCSTWVAKRRTLKLCFLYILNPVELAANILRPFSSASKIQTLGIFNVCVLRALRTRKLAREQTK